MMEICRKLKNISLARKNVKLGGMKVFLQPKKVSRKYVTENSSSPFPSVCQGCQILLATTYQNGKNIPNNQQIYQMAIRYLYHMAVKYTKYTNIFHFKTLQIYPIWIFGLKMYHLATPLCVPTVANEELS
jgi:hypothetical protein